MSNKEATIAKITRPGTHGVVHRERLFRLLDMAGEAPVVWVSGPAGSGKTTLVASYLDSRCIPCLWYSVDEGDRDIASFFFFMGLAAKKAAPGRRKALPLLTPEYLSGVPTFTRRYFENLYSRLISSHPPSAEDGRRGAVIVLDNYQEAQEDSAFHDLIVCGLDAIPREVNVIVLSRSEPPSSFARLRANEKIGLIGWEEIRLAPEESREIVRTKGNGKLSDEIAKELHDKCGGWAAGLILMIEAGKSGEYPLRLVGEPPRGEIFDYFAVEIFNKTDQVTRDFLLKTAFLPQMTARMAERLTGSAQAARTLARLCRDNFFTVKHSVNEDAYRYHNLFREFLLARSFDRFEAEEIKEIRRTSAELFMESGWIEDAALLFSQSGDIEGLVRLILRHAPSLMAQGRIKTLQEWIESVPGKITESEPWLLYWCGTCLLAFDPAESYPFFESAFQAFKVAGDPTGIFLSWAGAVSSIALGFKNIESLDSWFFMIDGLVARYAFPSELVQMQVLSAHFFAATYEPGYHDMDKWLEYAITLTQNSRDLGVRAEVLSGMALYLMIRRGDLARASIAVNLLRDSAQFEDVVPMARIATRLTESIYYEFTARHESCLTAVSDGLKTAEVTGVHVMDYLLLGQAAFSSLNTGDLAVAGRFIKEMASALKTPNRYHEAFYHYLSACEALRRNDIQQASAQIDMSLRLDSDLEIFQGSALNHAVKALILHELGRHDEAWQELSRAFHIGRRINSLYIEFSCLLTSAYFSFSEGNEAAGMASLRQAMTLGREQGLYLTFIWIPSVLTGLCAKALEEGLEVEYVQELIRRCRLGGEEEHASPFHPCTARWVHDGLAWSPGRIWIEQWPYYMKIYTLGKFGVFIDGEPVTFSGKGQQKPLLMLMALIALEGMEVDAEQLSDLLWPDADGDLSRLSFKFTLHQLRRLIGKEHVVQLKKGRVTLDPRLCWVDTWAFEHFFEQVEKAARQSGFTERIAEGENSALLEKNSWLHGPFALKFQNLADKAFDLYKGDFLYGESEHPWIFSMRERLKSKLIRLVDLTGSCHEKAGQWEKAAHYYRKALEANDLQEEFYRGIMRCCHNLGRRDEAISAYRRCCALLSGTLGMNPAPETDSLYRKICGKP